MPHKHKDYTDDYFDPVVDAWKRDPDVPDPLRGWGRLWLSAYQHCGVMFTACQKARISRRAVDYRIQEEPAFARLVGEAHENFIDRIEEKATQRALSGSDKMLEFVLRSKRPAEFDRPRVLKAKVDSNNKTTVRQEVHYDANELSDILSILSQAGALDSSGSGEDSEAPDSQTH